MSAPNEAVAIVVTSISAPNPALRLLAAGASAHGQDFVVIGDKKSPAQFDLAGCRFFGVDAQIETGFRFVEHCPTDHYARKNVGYLIAIAGGAGQIRETDDDNLPRTAFFGARSRRVSAPLWREDGWVNVYAHFSDTLIWPRGLPLDSVRRDLAAYDTLDSVECNCPIQQGLADGNPDVDAIYRMLLPLPQTFHKDRQVALSRGAWCPFNSQNTVWWPSAYPLLYLPAFCSFRMTDIWRSFVAQRIAWENDWCVLFRSPDVEQVRNEHDLMRDFADEMPGYINNTDICRRLDELDIRSGIAHIPENMRRCYGTLVEMRVVGQDELPLLDAWLADLEKLS